MKTGIRWGLIAALALCYSGALLQVDIMETTINKEYAGRSPVMAREFH